jgi:hypothetical protein
MKPVGRLSELVSLVRFAAGLPAFVRQKMTLDEARGIILRRMVERERNFLRSVERGVFGRPRSPYRSLLEEARCGSADLRAMVRRDGLEATLRALREAGVYVTFEEFKGLEPIIRNGREIPARPEDFDNPRFTRYYSATTGGTTGGGRRVSVDLEHLTARVPMQMVAEDIYGLIGIPTLLWFDILPGSGLGSVLTRVPYGNAPERWYSPISAGDLAPLLRYRVANRLIVEVARLSGAPVPRPKLLRLERAEVIAQWAAEALAKHGRCVVRTHVSKALRVCLAARELGIDLTGAVISAGGEPPTDAKVLEIERSGARFLSGYHFTEVGPVGLTCVNPVDRNDQHLFSDHLALIQHPRTLPGFDVTVDAFYFTTLLPTAPKLLLNVESDDCGLLETRSCGCPWEELGFKEHIRHIRSFRKLTGEGVTLLGSEMERILEEVLPARFGGSPLDYQLLEEEDEQGFTRLNLVVSPRLSIEDERELLATVGAALQRSSPAGDLSRAVWQQADTLRIRRMEPIWTRRGKLVPLQFSRREGPAREGANPASAASA